MLQALLPRFYQSEPRQERAISPLPIPPAPAVFDQCVIGVGAIGQDHILNGALLLVVAVSLERDFFAKDKFRGGMLGIVAIGVALLRQSLPLKRILSGCWLCKPSRVSPTTETTEERILFDRDTILSLKTRLLLAEIETQDEEAEMTLSASSLGCGATAPSAVSEGGSTLARRITPLNTKSWSAICIRRRRARISFPVIASRPLCDTIRIARSQGPNRAAAQTH
jgi:hypothetical protein